MAMTGTPDQSPQTNRPLWASAVDRGKPGIRQYAMDVGDTKSSARSPRPVPRITAVFASQCHRLRTTRAAAAIRSASVEQDVMTQLSLFPRQHTQDELRQLGLG